MASEIPESLEADFLWLINVFKLMNGHFNLSDMELMHFLATTPMD